jgi:hypothetical protein
LGATSYVLNDNNILSVFQVIAFDELKTDYKNPIDQCNSLNPVSIKITPINNIVALKLSLVNHRS